jgi:hypothetical protein
VGVAAGGLAAPARGATEEVAGGVVPAEDLGSIAAEVVAAGVASAGGVAVGAAALGGAVVVAEALPEGGVVGGMEVVPGVEATAPDPALPPTSGQTK